MSAFHQLLRFFYFYQLNELIWRHFEYDGKRFKKVRLTNVKSAAYIRQSNPAKQVILNQIKDMRTISASPGCTEAMVSPICR
jgi:hypothetical protein